MLKRKRAGWKRDGVYRDSMNFAQPARSRRMFADIVERVNIDKMSNFPQYKLLPSKARMQRHVSCSQACGEAAQAPEGRKSGGKHRRPPCEAGSHLRNCAVSARGASATAKAPETQLWQFTYNPNLSSLREAQLWVQSIAIYQSWAEGWSRCEAREPATLANGRSLMDNWRYFHDLECALGLDFRALGDFFSPTEKYSCMGLMNANDFVPDDSPMIMDGDVDIDIAGVGEIVPVVFFYDGYTAQEEM